MTQAPWYRRRLDGRLRVTIAVLGIAVLALGWFTTGTASFVVQLTLAVAAIVVLVIGVRRAPA